MTRAYHIIDADGHVLEPVDLWDKYIDPAYRDRAPRMIIDTDGKERLLVEGQVLGSKKGFGVVGAIGSRQGAVSRGHHEVRGGPAGRLRSARAHPGHGSDGIDAAFLYPSVGLFAGAVQEPALAAAMCRAYNRWLADYCHPYPDRLFGVAMLPMQSIELAIEEMRFAPPGARHARRLPAPQSLQRPDAAPPRLRAVLGARRRSSTSRSACTRAPAAACRRSASTASRRAGRGTSSPTPWR